jgi:acyl-coenzyme A thioesterase PaaI-like protein
VTSPAEFRAKLEEAKRSNDPSLVSAAVPYLRAMGMDMALREGSVVGIMRFSEPLIGNFAIRALHGGTLGALLETTAAMTILWRELHATDDLATFTAPRIVSITVDYLRTGRAVDTYARATITSAGRRVARLHVSAWQDEPDRPVASAQTCFLVG